MTLSLLLFRCHHGLNATLDVWVHESVLETKLWTVQAATFGRLNKGKLGIWEALQHLDTLPHYVTCGPSEMDNDRMSVAEHAIQTAELCRLASPQQDWFPLVGLIHSLGKLMALPR